MQYLKSFFAAVVLFEKVVLFVALSAHAQSTHKKTTSPSITVPSLGKEKGNDDQEEASIWDSRPEEISAVNVQILDKISGKVIKRRIEVGQPLEFGGIKVTLNRCFKNAPEDPREIYAFIEISERRPIFSRWLFASSPAINLFEHSQYDIRIEF